MLTEIDVRPSYHANLNLGPTPAEIERLKIHKLNAGRTCVIYDKSKNFSSFLEQIITSPNDYEVFQLNTTVYQICAQNQDQKQSNLLSCIARTKHLALLIFI